MGIQQVQIEEKDIKKGVIKGSHKFFSSFSGEDLSRSSNNGAARSWTEFRGCCGCRPGLARRGDSAWKNLAGWTVCGNQCDWSNIFNWSLQCCVMCLKMSDNPPTELVLKRGLSLIGHAFCLPFVWLWQVFFLGFYCFIVHSWKNIRIFTFLNELRLILHGSMHLRSSTTTEVHRTIIGPNDCFSSCTFCRCDWIFPEFQLEV